MYLRPLTVVYSIVGGDVFVDRHDRVEDGVGHWYGSSLATFKVCFFV